jgi:hypothetical protein
LREERPVSFSPERQVADDGLTENLDGAIVDGTRERRSPRGEWGKESSSREECGDTHFQYLLISWCVAGDGSALLYVCLSLKIKVKNGPGARPGCPEKDTCRMVIRGCGEGGRAKEGKGNILTKEKGGKSR